MTRAMVALAILGLGCGRLEQLLPPAPDGGHTTVPRSYLDARVSAGHKAHLALTGAEQLSCHDCHFIADAGFRADAVKPCAACHQRQQAQHHPFDGGVAMGCQSCHAFRSLGPLAGLDKWGCRTCHVDSRDAGALGPDVGLANPGHLPPHVTVHQEKCEQCHRPHGSPFTKAADCGQCHDIVATHGKGEKALPADTCMTCHPHHTKASLAQAMCVDCHLSAKVAPSARVKPEALFEDGHASCSTCHQPHRFVGEAAKPCASCHVAKPVLAATKHAQCTSCHQPHERRAEPKTCESCHREVHPNHPKDLVGGQCQGCHPPHSPTWADAGSIALACTSCHRQAEFTGAVHGAGVECKSCHQSPHQVKPVREAACASCHQNQVALVKKNPGHKDCASCHEGLPHRPTDIAATAITQTCIECHRDRQPPQKDHATCAMCHEPHAGTVEKTCKQCHDAPLPALHAIERHQQCSTCHAPHRPEPGVGPATCQKCHPTLPVKTHPTRPQQCVSCHLFGERKR